VLNLIVVRHAATNFTAEGRYQGHRDEPLSEEGRAQARALGDRLRHAWADELGTALLYTSDLTRARQTAALALDGLEAIPDARLREMRFGSFEGLTAAEIEQRTPEAYRAWIQTPERCAPPGGETLVQLEQRVREWLHGLTTERTIVAVSHGGAMRMLLALVTNSTFQSVRSLPIEPTDAAHLVLWPDTRTSSTAVDWLRSGAAQQ
jgi:alpha-ribazole phosphatase